MAKKPKKQHRLGRGLRGLQHGTAFEEGTPDENHRVSYKVAYHKDPGKSYIIFKGNVRITVAQLMHILDVPYHLDRSDVGYRRFDDFTKEEIELYYPFALVLACLDGNAFTNDDNPDLDLVRQYVPDAYHALKINSSLEWVLNRRIDNPAVQAAWDNYLLVRKLARE